MLNGRFTQRASTISATALVAVLASNGSLAQIYRYVDERGNVTFTDKVPADDESGSAEEIELRETNSSRPPPNVPRAQVDKTTPEEAAVEYTTTITSPADSTTIPMGPGNFAVTATTYPNLKGGEALQLTIDGAAVGEPQSAGAWQLTNVNRGEHKLVVERLGNKRVLDSSDPLTVYVMRPSIR